MQTTLTKDEFDEFIIQYIRESLRDKRHYQLVESYEDDKWGYFLKLLNARGLEGQLNAFKTYDNLDIRTDVKIHIPKLLNNNTIIIQT
jgi:hypothetical protein